MRPIDGDVLADRLRGALHIARLEYEYEAEMELNSILRDVETLPEIKIPHWIPVSEAIPMNDRKVLCQTMTRKGVPGFVLGYFANERWCCGMNSNVVAWMELPDPWEGRKE